MKRTLTGLEDVLNPTRFLRISQSEIINSNNTCHRTSDEVVFIKCGVCDSNADICSNIYVHLAVQLSALEA